MIKLRRAFLDWVRHQGEMRRWGRAARNASGMSHAQLRAERARARKLVYSLNEVVSVADNRLALPVIGSNAFPKPHGTDWSWRPALWREPLAPPGICSAASRLMLGDEVTLFHDCAYSEVTLRQLRNSREADLAPYGLRMEVFSFDGTFLSLVLDLPVEAVDRLTRRHLIRMDTIIETETPQKIFVRLNVKHGPNTEQLVRELPLHDDNVMVEFDLAYSQLNEKRIERAWIDLIFDSPQMSQVILRDLTFGRRPRAEF